MTEEEGHTWMVRLGPFESYPEALAAASPIHAEHEEEYGVAIVEFDETGAPIKVII